MKQKILIYGASGHSRVILDIIEKLHLNSGGLLDDDEEKKGQSLYGQQILGGKEFISTIAVEDYRFIIGIGDNQVRKKIALDLNKMRVCYTRLIHPSVQIATDVTLGEGTIAAANSVVNTGAVIGRHCILNTSSSVDHDCRIGDYVHISPGAHLGGNVLIGEGTWIGLGASVINNIKIGKHAIIGAGSVIIRNVPEMVVVAGNPARIIRKLP